MLDPKQPHKLLVTYATWLGSTAEIAEAIGQELRELGHEVDVEPVQDIAHVGQYGTIILGGPIIVGRWSPDVMRFLEAHRLVLQHRHVAYFVVCLTMREDTPDSRRIVMDYITPALHEFPEIKPIEIGMFAGSLDIRKLPGPAKLKFWSRRRIHGDFRNWTAIRDWTDHLIHEIEATDHAIKA